MKLDVYLSPSAEHLRVAFNARDVEHPDDLEVVDVTLTSLAEKQFEVKLPSLQEELKQALAGTGQVSIVVFSNGRVDITMQ